MTTNGATRSRSVTAATVVEQRHEPERQHDVVGVDHARRSRSTPPGGRPRRATCRRRRRPARPGSGTVSRRSTRRRPAGAHRRPRSGPASRTAVLLNVKPVNPSSRYGRRPSAACSGVAGDDVRHAAPRGAARQSDARSASFARERPPASPSSARSSPGRARWPRSAWSRTSVLCWSVSRPSGNQCVMSACFAAIRASAAPRPHRRGSAGRPAWTGRGTLITSSTW